MPEVTTYPLSSSRKPYHRVRVPSVRTKKLSQHDSPWTPGDEPYGLTLNPYTARVEELGIIKLCSFRAAFTHKLHVVLRAHGGWNHKSIHFFARSMGVHYMTVSRWASFRHHPESHHLEKLDRLYSECLDLLKAGKLKIDIYREEMDKLQIILGGGTCPGGKQFAKDISPRQRQGTGGGVRRNSRTRELDPQIVNAKWTPEEISKLV